jgi:RNA-directed DNA polymerase
MKREEQSAPVSARDKQAEEDLWQRHGAERGVWTEPMLAALERGLERNKWFSLIDKVWSERTLGLAWEKVKSNAGACGVDGITIERFGKDSQSRLLAVKEQIKQGRYQPKPVKRVWIPKPGSAEKRPLGIPTVEDRVVQAALRMVIEPIFESSFAEQSYGFRPGRGCKDALRRVEALLKGGYTHVVDVDIKGYFDTINHEGLMRRVRERIADGRVLAMLEGFLKQGVMEGENWQEAKEGTPQGGVISPLLANIYLDPLDKQMSESGIEMVRYADDMVILCRNREEADAALAKVKDWMEENELTLHPEKTRTVDMNQAESHIDFLGYRFQRSRKGKLLRLVRPKSRDKLRDAIRAKTRRANGKSMAGVIAEVNRTLKGWYAYFKQVHPNVMKETDSWIRMRLRSILRRRAGRRGRSRKRENIQWGNHYFQEHGLFSLLAARELEMANLRQGANL